MEFQCIINVLAMEFYRNSLARFWLDWQLNKYFWLLSTCTYVFWKFTGKKYGAKRAQLSAWITLHSIPEETIITPNILEFLEQALEPIPTFNVRDTSAEAAAAGHPAADPADMFEDSSSGSHAGQAVTSANLTSFPVEVIVYFHMQSSTFRFSCIPMSRVECMLRLPSLDMVCMN